MISKIYYQNYLINKKAIPSEKNETTPLKTMHSLPEGKKYLK
jgi:hypothetical protein